MSGATKEGCPLFVQAYKALPQRPSRQSFFNRMDNVETVFVWHFQSFNIRLRAGLDI